MVFNYECLSIIKYDKCLLKSLVNLHSFKESDEILGCSFIWT